MWARDLGISVISGIAAEADADKADYLTFRFSDLELDREYYLVYNRGITLTPIASGSEILYFPVLLSRVNRHAEYRKSDH